MYPVAKLDYPAPDQQYPFQNYYNVELDDYVYCEFCEEDVYEYCTTHGPLLEVPDEVPSEEDLRLSGLPWAALTLPRDALYIAPSTMPGGALGVYAAMDLPARVSFGPYRGWRRAPGTSASQPYAWAVLDSAQRPVCEVDASDPQRSNWLRYVNCARHQRHQNLVAYQYRRNIYYRTIKPIPKYTELLVYLGSDVAYWLGVHVCSYAYMNAVAYNDKPALGTAIMNDDLKNNIDENNEIHNYKTTLKPTAVDRNVDENVTREKNEKIIEENPTNNKETMMYSESCYTVKTHINNTTAKRALKTDKSNIHYIHTHMSEKAFKCDRCEYSTTQKSHLQRHIRTHTGERPFKCERCEYSTTQKIHLQTHIRTHTGEKPFKCDRCEYSATTKSNLQKHIRTHTGERPFKCERCEYSATQKNVLQTHIRTHTGERPFKCDRCEYSATQKSNIQKHIRIHTGERPFKCDRCEFSATQKSDLQRHIRTHTG
ncbi:hypothetical protein EVAR_98396_1 [Eumeta japonica]|uniref:Uncharacterized protein n=1 Tax=Eumeta variegata TaxID=151549 RepID=A0A4C1XRK7_EUMVA|nr:hypothetical protein EVAR_98396_1 [Eumeta japonica]